MKNPYWEEIKDLVTEGRIPREYDELRWRYCSHYTMAIPDPETVAFVTHHLSPQAVEIGAGTGYWAWLMAQQGIDILAYDIAPPDHCTVNSHHSPRDGKTGRFLDELRKNFARVQVGGPEVLRDHAERTLFLCWPPYRSSMAVQCLRSYAGHRVVYLGEGEGDSCANDAFFHQLQRGWREIARQWPVHWYNIYDRVTIYERQP